MKLADIQIGVMYGHSTWRNASRTNPVFVLAIEQTETDSPPSRHNGYRRTPVKRRKVLVQFYDEKALLRGRKVKVGEPKHVDGAELHWTWETEVKRREDSESGAVRVAAAKEAAYAAAKDIEQRLKVLTEIESGMSASDTTSGYAPSVTIRLYGEEPIAAFQQVLKWALEATS